MADLPDGIHRIDTPLGERRSSLWLVRGRSGTVLFDTGTDATSSDHLMPYFGATGIDPREIRHVVVSHADVDHFGGIADVHERLPEARVAVHEADAPLVADYAAFEDQRVRGFREPWGVDEDPAAVRWCASVTRVDRVDDLLSGGERFDLGDREVEVRHVSGHSRGHLALHDVASGAWLVSDAVLGDAVPFSNGQPAFPPTYRFVDDYLATLDQVERARPSMIGTAHYGTYDADGAMEFIDVSRRFVAELDQAVLEALAETGPVTLGVLLQEVNRRVARWPLHGTETALAFPVVGHLERFCERGQVTIDKKVTGGAALIKLMGS